MVKPGDRLCGDLWGFNGPLSALTAFSTAPHCPPPPRSHANSYLSQCRYNSARAFQSLGEAQNDTTINAIAMTYCW